ncbi:aldose epimerase family protein [Liquorilactobacillus vini]|uniref:Aldose 1-epimerase n=1 Tax=Liquorilactobacillus vini DSM 20605 TaxID=1133569 RepID=A0A0R2C6C6_9LACO|nr:aldose epimerase family protein [Liquorilactobacillus vini]KRM83977.1 aldose 1-epimerase [Liquorilactobacillus vini DSM 20605]
MKTNLFSFGTFRGNDVYQYSVENSHGVKISVLSQGGILYEVSVPTKEGRKNLVLNFQTINEYYDNPFYVCMAIGLTAGRLTQGKFMLNNKKYKIEPNEGSNVLHGGKQGFSTVNWNGTIHDNKIILGHRFTEREGGFPGNIEVRIIYSVNEDNEIKVSFSAISDKVTLFNPTLHVYWNLSQEETIFNHKIKINSDKHLKLGNDKLPLGEFLVNVGTPFDFSKERILGDAIKELSNTSEKGFDDIFLVEPDSNGRVAKLSANKKSVEIFSNRNGLVLFTANSFTKNMKLLTENGHPWMGVATEAQNLPDGINQVAFPNDDILYPKEKRTEYIKYKVNF